MFKGKETIKHKIDIPILAVILLSFYPQVFAQQQDFIELDNFGKFLFNEPMNIEVVTDISKDITLYGIPTAFTVFDQAGVQSPVQKTNPEIPWIETPINLTDYDLHKWIAETLGLYDPHPEKSDIQEVSILSYSDELLDVKALKFEDVRLIESKLISEESMQGENALMGLFWKINKNIDIAIVGQHMLDMTYPDFIDYMKNEVQTKRALYAKLILRF